MQLLRTCCFHIFALPVNSKSSDNSRFVEKSLEQSLKFRVSVPIEAQIESKKCRVLLKMEEIIGEEKRDRLTQVHQAYQLSNFRVYRVFPHYLALTLCFASKHRPQRKHSSEVAFLLRTHQYSVRLLAIPRFIERHCLGSRQ